jgi:hypothetical protein
MVKLSCRNHLPESRWREALLLLQLRIITSKANTDTPIKQIHTQIKLSMTAPPTSIHKAKHKASSTIYNTAASQDAVMIFVSSQVKNNKQQILLP